MWKAEDALQGCLAVVVIGMMIGMQQMVTGVYKTITRKYSQLPLDPSLLESKAD